MRRVIVIGVTGSGKTTLARQLAEILACPHVELDSLHWEPGWQEAALPIFRERVAAALAGSSWTVDGNYRKVRDLIWPRADTLVWIDYRFSVVFGRLLRRTLTRITKGTELWNGNRERLGALFGRESIIVWLFKTYWRRKREIPALLQQPGHAHLTIVHLRTPAETERWLAGLNAAPAQALTAQTNA